MVLLALLDFSKAFDTLNHKLLLAKLHYIGFSEHSIQLIKDFLTDRSQVVSINNTVSDNIPLNKGVPQGSILGPLLFSIYVFDLCNRVTFSKIHMFADDTQIYLSFDPKLVNVAVENINNDLSAISKYCVENCLTLNESKSAVMLFGSEKIRQEFICNGKINITINNVKINISNTCKNLGLLLDHRLRFVEYISLLIKKAFFALKNLYMNRFVLSKQNRVYLSSSLVLSVFNYCDTIYGSHITSRDANRIQRMQNCCVRFIFGLRRRDNVTYYLAELGWLNMRQTRQLHVAGLAHRIVQNKSPDYLYEKLTVRTQHHQRNLRNKLHYHLPSHKSALYKRTYSYIFPQTLNKLPPFFMSLQSKSFIKNLKNLLLNDDILA